MLLTFRYLRRIGNGDALGNLRKLYGTGDAGADGEAPDLLVGARGKKDNREG